MEFILVDDGSIDNPELIYDQMEQKDNRVKVLHKNNGRSAARNSGTVKMQ